MLLSRKARLLTSATVIALSAGFHAQAQTNNVSAQPAKYAMQEVVVTASRRAETVQNVAGSVTALTGSQLARQHAVNFNDFAASVPGLSFQSNSPTNNLIAIRGVASSTAELGSAVSIYFDDVPLGASTQFGLGSQAFNFNLFDMDRVEVLNGPQGTLYGANALGGALKYETVKPKFDHYQASIEAEGSNTAHGSYNDAVRAMVNVPIGDRLAIRVDGLKSYDAGYTQDPTHGRSNVGSARDLGGRVSLLAQITPEIDLRLTALSQDIVGSGQNVSFRNIRNGGAAAGAYNQSYALEQPEENAVQLYSGVINWDLHWAKVTSVTAYQRNHGYYQTDDSVFYGVLMPLYTGLPSTGTDPYDLYVDTDTRKFTQELRIASSDNKFLEWVLGGYYTHESTNEQVNLLDSTYTSGNLPAPFSSYPFYGYLPSTYDEEAVFGDATYYVTPSFDITAGFRYSHQHQNYGSNLWWIGFGPPYGKVYPYDSTSDQGITTYLFNPRYHLNENSMLYARVSSGFRPGGPNFVLPPSFHSPAPAAFQPDKIWNYEIGEKSQFFDRRAVLDFDLYDIEWHDIQTTQNVNGINQLVNAGNARVRGAEMNASYRVSGPLTISAAAAWTEAHFITQAPVLDVLYTGARLPISPKFNFSLSATYNFDLSDYYHGSANISDVWVGARTSGYYGSYTNILYRLPAYNTMNLNFALYAPKNIEFDVYVKNLFDSEGQLSANTLNNVFYPNAPVPVAISQPRTIGLVMKYNFTD